MAWQPGFEQNRVSSELRVEKRNVPKDSCEGVDTDVSFIEVLVASGQGVGAAWTSEGPPSGHLEWCFSMASHN